MGMSYLLPLGGFNRGRVETFPKAHPIREGAKQRNSFHFWRLIELVRAHPQPPSRTRFARAREANDEAPASEHAAGVDGRTLTEYCSRPRASGRWRIDNYLGSLAVGVARAHSIINLRSDAVFLSLSGMT